MCLVEARNANWMMRYHLSRCDDAETAAAVFEIFSSLAAEFEKKMLALDS